jgi:hypothetical protein
MRFTHPYSHKVCTIKRTQVPIMPAFAMTTHKAQGQTMDKVIVDLESCHGTESPYVMLSRVKSLDGLRILRPFSITKIQCRQSEDTRRELRCLNSLQLFTITELGSTLESVQAQDVLSRTKYRDQIFTENHEENDSLSRTSDSIRRLQHLQQKNIHLTSAPCPPLPNVQNNLSTISTSRHEKDQVENEQNHHSTSFSQLS